MSSTISRLKTMAFWAVLLLITLVLLEGVLHLCCLISPQVQALLTSGSGQSVDDEKLGWRPNPLFPDHDKKGFRNRAVPERVDVVCLGDSMTYGVWVDREDAWPQQLEKTANVTTYNMGYAGYEPTRSLLMVDEVLELHPKLVVEAVYLGNDLWEAYSNVYNHGRLPDLKTTDEALLRKMADRDKELPVVQSANVLFEPHRNWKDFLGEDSEIYALMWISKRMLLPHHTWPWFWIKFRASRFAPWEPFEHGDITTVLTPTYRLIALDQTDPRNSEGLRLCLEALRRINERLRQAGVRFLVLLIPTKELALEEMVKSGPAQPSKNYGRLVQNEKLVWKSISDNLTGKGIPVADPLPELRRSLREGRNPYLINHDAHPNKKGQEIIAASVLEAIRSHNLLQSR